MTADRTEAIRSYFSRQRERADARYPNPLFRGREVAVDRIVADAIELIGSDRPAPNLSRILYGAPGAGKSEILVQLRRRLEALGTNKRPVWVVDGNADMLHDAVAFETHLQRQLPRDWVRNLWDWVEVSGGIQAGPVSLSVSRKDDPALPELTRLTYLADALVRKANDPTVVLLVDEAQDEVSDAREAGPTFARALHKADIPLKVLPVYAGLGNTPVELARCGVSRPEPRNCHLLECLDGDVAESIARDGLAALTGRDNGEIGAWARRIAADSQGWPKHLSNTLGAVAGIARSQGWTMSAADFERAMKEADAARANYYSDRLKRMRGALKAEQYSRWARMFDRREAVTSTEVARAMGLDSDAGDRLVGLAVRAGVLEERRSDEYVAPIPSMIAHIAARGREAEPSRYLER